MNPRALVALVMAGSVVALGIVAARWWDRSDPAPIRAASVLEGDAVPPSPLDPDRVSTTPVLDVASPSGMRLEKGGWVQVANPDGSLAQQYSATRLDPEPGQWLAMQEPRALFYLENGRVVTLRADEARTYVPQRALERGDFKGNVIAKVFAPGPDGEVHLASDAPSMVFEATVADVDFLHGTIRCTEDVRVTTPTLRFEGRDMDLRMSSDRKTIESLHVEHVIGPITLDRALASSMQGASGGVPETPGGALGASPTIVGARSAVAGNTAVAAAAASTAAMAATFGDVPFHRVTLTDNVKIVRYTTGPASSFEGDRLEATLALDGDLVDAGGVTIPGAPETAMALPMPEGLPLLALVSPASAVNAGPSRDMIAIWADGPLSVVRAAPEDRVPATIDGVLLFLDGSPLALSDDRGHTLTAPDLDMELERASGATIPRTMVARGGVVASDRDQTLWSDSLRVRFAPDGKPAAADSDPLLGSTSIERADAEGGVELQLKDGARAWGDRVQAWPNKRQADLHGPGVQVVRGNTLLHDVERIQVDEASRTVTSPGSGKATIFSDVIIGAGKTGRLGVPSVDGLRRQSWAAWTESMQYVDRAALGATLSVRGAVQLRSEPDDSEYDILEAEDLGVQLAPTRPASATAAGLDAAAGGPLEPSTIHAVGAVRLESQLWPGAKDGSRGEPEVFRIQSEDLTWDAQTEQASVPVAGDMLMHRPAQAGQAAATVPTNGPGSTRAAMPGARGTSRFRWKGSMQLENRVDALSQVRMEREVEIVHVSLDRKAKTTLTCDRAVAVLDRRSASKPAPTGNAAADPIQFGSGGDLIRLLAEGRCFIRSPEYDIDCDSIEYDAKTQVAILKARPGRNVAITPAQGGSVIHAVEATWDMATGRIRVQNARGSAAR